MPVFSRLIGFGNNAKNFIPMKYFTISLRLKLCYVSLLNVYETLMNLLLKLALYAQVLISCKLVLVQERGEVTYSYPADNMQVVIYKHFCMLSMLHWQRGYWEQRNAK
jgi:hypothetical protein